MAITPKSPATVSPPNTLTQESAASVAVANTLTQESAASVAVPNTLTQESAASVAVPNTLTQESAASVSVPNTLTQEAAASVAVPNTLTQESAATVAVANTLTQEAVAGFPRCLTPKIAFDFADEKYSLCGKPKALSDITTYSRASSATFINRRVDGCTGDYEYFVDTDYVGSVTNLALYSEQFDNAAWTKARASVTSDNTLDPNGNRTAERLVEDSTSSSTHYIQQGSITVTTATNYTFSVYAKAGSRRYIRLRETSGVTAGAYFDLTTGVIGPVAGTGDPIPSIESIGDGWFKCSLTFTSSGTSSIPRILITKATDTEAYDGDGESYVYIWGAQLTESAKPLPYVQTTTASASETFSESVRIEYDPATGDSLGALIEGASTNLCLRSEEFTSTWTQSAVSATDNAILAPDGTTSGGKLDEDGTTADHLLFQAVNVTSGEDYSFSVYAKANENPYVQLTFQASMFGSLYANFDLSAGTVAVESSCTATIKDVGNGWYRCAISAAATSTGAANAIVALIESSSDTRSPSYAGTAGDGVYLWGAQVEELPFPSSYIRTEGSAVSRSADNLSGSLIDDSDQLTINFNGDVTGDMTSINQFMFSAGSNSANYHCVLANASDSKPRFFGITSAGTQYSLVATGYDFADGHNVSGTFKVNDVELYIDGVSVGTDAVSTAIPITQYRIGDVIGGGSPMYGHVKMLAFYDRNMTAKEVELL